MEPPISNRLVLWNRDNGPITIENSGAYVDALKDYIASDMQQLLFDNADWDAGEAGWYKLVPLGAMWGNDPDVDSPETCDYLVSPDNPDACPALERTWFNPDVLPLPGRRWVGVASGGSKSKIEGSTKP